MIAKGDQLGSGRVRISNTVLFECKTLSVLSSSISKPYEVLSMFYAVYGYDETILEKLNFDQRNIYGNIF